MKLLFIRHAESEFNVATKTFLSGNKDNNSVTKNEIDRSSWESKYNVYMNESKLIDCGITKNGEKQASKLNFDFDLLILSPMKRCIDTYKYSNIKCQNIIICDLFREYKIDICDFLKFEIEQYNKNKKNAKMIYFVRETEKQLIKRVELSKIYLKNIINDYCNNKSKDKNNLNICVLTHNDFTWYFTSEIIEKERFGTHLDNCQNVEIDIDQL